MSNNDSEAKAIIEAARQFGDAEILALTETTVGPSVLSVPSGRHIVSMKQYLDEYRTAPERKRGTAVLTTLESFVEHVNRHKDADSVVFADVTSAAPKLLAVFDYNRQGPEGGPRFGQHRASYAFPVSPEWSAWKAATEKGFMDQRPFAEFLEDRISDVLAEPGKNTQQYAEELGLTVAKPQRLLELSRGLSINVGAKVASSNNLSSGERQVVFAETHQGEDGGPVKIPGAFAIGIPVFRGGVVYQLPVRLRYRVANQAVVFAVSIERADKAWDDAVNEAAAEAKQKTALPLFFGTPEG